MNHRGSLLKYKNMELNRTITDSTKVNVNLLKEKESLKNQLEECKGNCDKCKCKNK